MRRLASTFDKIDGHYKNLRSFRPLDHESRDIGQFIDDDGNIQNPLTPDGLKIPTTLHANAGSIAGMEDSSVPDPTRFILFFRAIATPVEHLVYHRVPRGDRHAPLIGPLSETLADDTRSDL